MTANADILKILLEFLKSANTDTSEEMLDEVFSYDCIILNVNCFVDL